MSCIYESKYSKSTITYDDNAGLAYEIGKTFKSPIKRNSNNSSGRSSPENNLICCSCLELIGGKLFTCSRCESSFHSLCHFPPILINDRSKRSNWLCNRCKSEVIFNREQTMIKSILDVQQKEEVLNQSITRFKLSQLVNQGTHFDQLQNLAKALRSINAREFTLENLEIDQSFYKLPFDEVYDKEEQVQCEKPCFYCKSFVKGQMIMCDYCGTFFCFDCLHPPITSLPNQRFMCPLHVEKFIDAYMVNSLKVTERMDLWKQYTDHSGPEIISIFCKFLRKDAPKRNEKENTNINTINQSTSKIIKKNKEHATKFKVNNLIKKTYAKILAQNKITNGNKEHQSLQSTSNNLENNIAANLDSFEFFPGFFDVSLPIYAALYIISGADKNFNFKNCIIPIQSKMITLGLYSEGNNSIDLSQFTSCTAIEQQTLFFDKSKLAFEIVSSNLFPDSFVKQKFGLQSCKCFNFFEDCVMSLNEDIVPAFKSSVLWNGAIIRIGCLRILFSCLGTL